MTMNIENETNVEKNAVLSVSERRRDYVGTAAVCVNSVEGNKEREGGGSTAVSVLQKKSTVSVSNIQYLYFLINQYF